VGWGSGAGGPDQTGPEDRELRPESRGVGCICKVWLVRLPPGRI
jgi:hypothetical protein